MIFFKLYPVSIKENFLSYQKIHIVAIYVPRWNFNFFLCVLYFKTNFPKIHFYLAIPNAYNLLCFRFLQFYIQRLSKLDIEGGCIRARIHHTDSAYTCSLLAYEF